jgi:ADP-ribosylation factor-like protein 6
MGIWSNFLIAVGLVKRKVNVLFVGLDNSGKSTIISRLKTDQVMQVIKRQSSIDEIPPTVGFTVEKFSKSKLSFTAFDMSGQGKYRDLWEHYFLDTDSIVFVIDSSDKMRISVCKDELDTLLKHRGKYCLNTSC